MNVKTWQFKLLTVIIFVLMSAMIFVLQIVHAGTDNVATIYKVERFTNPLHDPVQDDDSGEVRIIKRFTSRTYNSANAEIVYRDTLAECSKDLREGMTNREGQIAVHWRTSPDADFSFSEIYNDVFYGAFDHTGKSNEGDILKWIWSGCAGEIRPNRDNSYYYVTLVYDISYRTTAAQELELQQEIDNLQAEWAIDEKSDQEIIKHIYDYMCQNIEYDHENLEDDTYELKYTDYAALMNKTSVCQGYAMLFYRFALEYGIDCRLITGIGNGGGHAWNIVQLGDLYYYVDATWDAPRYPNYEYYLLGRSSFYKDHTCDEEYLTETFAGKYPVPDADFDGELHRHEISSIIKSEPTCANEGIIKYNCSQCAYCEEVAIPKVTTHTWDNGQISVAPTCVAEGTRTFACTVDGCGKTRTESIAIDKNTHPEASMIDLPAKAATCKETGLTTGKKCTACGVVTILQTEVPKLTTHSYDNGILTMDSTCIAEGEKSFTCIVCNDTKTESVAVDKNAHPEASMADLPAKAATCKESGLTEGVKCTACGVVTVPQTEVPKLTIHSYNTGAVTKQPTCTAEGELTFTCIVCDETKTEPIPLNMDAHPAAGMRELPEKAATCKESGLTAGEKCTACGVETVPQTEVPKLRTHTYGEDHICDVCEFENEALMPTPEVTPTPEPEVQPTPEPTPEATPSPEPTPMPDVTPTPEPEENPVPEVTPTPEPEVTPTPEQEKNPAPEPEAQPAPSPEVTPTPEKYEIGKVSLSVSAYVYNGRVKSPKVIVKDNKGNVLKKGTDYTVFTPKGRKAIGKYTYTIKFKGNYADTKSKKMTLTIKPAKPTIKTPAAAKKAITVKWKRGKKAQTTGYQVMVASNSKFTKGKKSITVKGYNKVSKKVTGLKAKTKYYVKVRTYKIAKVNGKNTKIYSDWSKVKTIRTK